MRGSGNWTRFVCFSLSAFMATVGAGCNKEDVAPQMQKPPSTDSWDAPPQESPEPPPPGGAGGGKGEGGTGEARQDGDKPGDPPPGKPGDPPPGKPGDDNSPGRNGEPPPQTGANGEAPPPPSGDDIPLGAPPLPEGVKGVKLKGTIIYPDYKQGLIQIDVSDKSTGNGKRGSQPKIIQLYRMAKPGTFEMEIPENQGEIWLSAYNDADKNGRPSREEPRGTASGNPFKVGTAALEGVEIKLEKEKIPAPP